VFYTASANSIAQVGPERIEQIIQLVVKIIQGEVATVSFELNGLGEVVEVQGDNLKSWAVRQESAQRFLDLYPGEGATDLNTSIKIRSPEFQLPTTAELTHIAPGNSVGFNSIVNINYSHGVEGNVAGAAGFSSLDSDGAAGRFQTTTGGKIKLVLNRSGAAPASIELTGTRLEGDLDSNEKSIGFELRSTAHVTEAGAEITVLSGNAAATSVPATADYRLKLSTENEKPVYRIVFARPGTFQVELDFVAPLVPCDGNWQRMDFTVAASAVVPLTLKGLDSELDFQRDQQSVVPLRDDDNWTGFLPATGRARLQWKMASDTGEGKLFFTTTAYVDSKVGVGLLRQSHLVNCQVLQGELKSLKLRLEGPGQILDVQGSNIVAWRVSGEAEDRQLDVTLSHPISSTGQISVRSQTPLGAFPIRVEGLRLNPTGAIRHSGYLRLTNLGSVRLEPTGLVGLTQLAPEQYPGGKIEARQKFVYRFPAANYDFEVIADRIQPEINISELVLYGLAETDRVINADIELDIREAPVREWDCGIPSDYSVVSVAGAGVADYIAASEVTDGTRNLKVMFGQDVEGRQLVHLHLEKNEAAASGDWELPRITYPGAKSARGNIGVIGTPGFRIAVGETDLLVEKPLSYFPKPTENLQQAFRIREPGWSATMRIELLGRSVQADLFHLYSLSEGAVYGSALINYFVTGAPVSEWNITVPELLDNVMVDGQDVRTWRRDGDKLIVSLHQPVIGPYTLLVTFEEKPEGSKHSFQAGLIAPNNVQGERGYIQVVSPMQVEINTISISDDLLSLDPLELPVEFRLLSAAPPLGTWQYTERPFECDLKVDWFQPGTMVTQVVEFSEANSRVSQDGELVTDVLYYVKSRGQRTLKITLPDPPVRLWEVLVSGRPVTARQAGNATLIPLPGGTDPNIPVEVRLRLGKPTVSESHPTLTLPTVFAPVLKTQWNISGDEQRVLVSHGGTVAPSKPILQPTGFSWIARRGLLSLVLIGVLAVAGSLLLEKTRILRVFGLIALAMAIGVAVRAAKEAQYNTEPPAELQLNLPILSAEEIVEIQVQNMPLWWVNMSLIGLFVSLGGVVAIARSFVEQSPSHLTILRIGGVFLVALGVLLHRASAPWFYGMVALAILGLLFLPQAFEWLRDIGNWLRRVMNARFAKKEEAGGGASNAEPGPVTALWFLCALFLSSLSTPCQATVPGGFEAANSIGQEWQIFHEDNRLSASGTITLSGKPGDRFLLLRAPAILTHFEGEGLRLTKSEVSGHGMAYIISIPVARDELATDESAGDESEEENIDSAAQILADYEATFEFQLEALELTKGVPVLTGSAAVQEIDVTYDEAGWSVSSPTAVRVEPMDAVESATRAKVLMGPGRGSIMLNPKARDVTAEETHFFAEMWNLYVSGPGVVTGRHRVDIRVAQGQVEELNVLVPKDLTVSQVTGPVSSWQFDAESGRLKLGIEPAQSQSFGVFIATERGLDPLPADVKLVPLMVDGANGEVGLVAIAFGPDAQPEKSEPIGMSAVNLGDFDTRLIPDKQTVVHHVYRYGAEGGELNLRVAPVEPEVRVASKQVVSLGDERVVIGINFAADISRAGLFQLRFPLPEGFEVESLTGAALHHWAELREGNQRMIIIHLNGKTLGTQKFSLSLAGPAPTEAGDWKVPRFELEEATRQTGELVVQPATGIRLRTISRQNVSEIDPRMVGGNAQGALAFRLLQHDWDLVLGVEKLDPWVTGQVLHDVILREGQTRSTLIANFNVQNASIRTLQVALPISDKDEIKTLRASGKIVSDFVRIAPDSNIWEVQFKRRAIANIQFRIEYERRGVRTNGSEQLNQAAFPQARQLSYYFGVRAGGRLEIEHDTLPKGWQRADWNTVPQSLREAGNRNAPALTLRAVAVSSPLTIRAQRHSLADALKLRVAQGRLTTILSPTGDQLTAVDLTMEVIQRSNLSVGLPIGGELFSIFVNNESVHSVRQPNTENAWQFYILPGIDDRTAKVRFVFSVPGNRLHKLNLTSPQLNVPLEQIEWNVIVPNGFELTDNDGNLELMRQARQGDYDRGSYLSKISQKRNAQAQQAAKLLEQANQFLQAGEQSKARRALSNVANQYALDEASNEDARVQLKNLQTQQAVVGLNTRRQRIFLYNEKNETAVAGNNQLREAAADNPILQQDQLNFRPQQLSQLLRGNTVEGNAVLQRIAGRLVQHQRTTEPAPQAITISLPEEGNVYTFGRSVQVAENAPLELDLHFRPVFRTHLWQATLVLVLLIAVAAPLAFGTIGKEAKE
jgi:hypothetical protein